jgi:hypothetical protein
MQMEAISKLKISMGIRVGSAIVSSLLGLAWLVGGMSGVTRGSECVACPFCSAASQTLRQESLSMDAVAIASLVSDGRLDIDGNATFVVERILRGDSLLEKGQKVEASYFGPGKTEKKFLLLGVDPRNLVWSSPLPLTEDAVKYVEAIQKLPEDPIARLEFYQQHFEHPDSLLARDSYDEFALAPYEEVKNLKSKMNREQLMDWIRDPQISPDRKRLYFTMMGICGTNEDAVEIDDSKRRPGQACWARCAHRGLSHVARFGRTESDRRAVSDQSQSQLPRRVFVRHGVAFPWDGKRCHS